MDPESLPSTLCAHSRRRIEDATDPAWRPRDARASRLARRTARLSYSRAALLGCARASRDGARRLQTPVRARIYAPAEVSDVLTAAWKRERFGVHAPKYGVRAPGDNDHLHFKSSLQGGTRRERRRNAMRCVAKVSERVIVERGTSCAHLTRDTRPWMRVPIFRSDEGRILVEKYRPAASRDAPTHQIPVGRLHTECLRQRHRLNAGRSRRIASRRVVMTCLLGWRDNDHLVTMELLAGHVRLKDAGLSGKCCV